jgi:P4 family phage/plasmid primase-like protien
MKRVRKMSEENKKENKEEDLTKEKVEKLEKEKKEAVEELEVQKYFTTEKTEPKFNAMALAEDIKKIVRFITLRDTEEVFYYNEKEGIWEPYGETIIEEKAREILGSCATQHYINETVAAIKQTTYTSRDIFNSLSLEEIPVANGVLNWKTKQLRSFKPEDYLTYKLPVIYNPNAKCENFNKFLSEIVREEDVQLVKEMFAYCLHRSYINNKAFMLVGDGANGKSTLLEVLTAFLGKENVSSVALQDLLTNRFAAAELYGKLANIYADLPADILKDTGKFKILTGGDLITAERKFKNLFQFVNYAKLIFSTNNVPYASDQSDAFYRRWIIINFPYKFVDNPTNQNENKKDDQILKKLITPEELSGILNECIENLPRLLEKGFSYRKTTEEIRNEYLRVASPIAAFVMDCVIEDPDSFVLKEELYTAYCEYCRKNNLPIKTNTVFHKELRKYVKVSEENKRFDKERKRVYLGIRLVEQVEQAEQVVGIFKVPRFLQTLNMKKVVPSEPPVPLQISKEVNTSPLMSQAQSSNNTLRDKAIYWVVNNPRGYIWDLKIFLSEDKSLEGKTEKEREEIIERKILKPLQAEGLIIINPDDTVELNYSKYYQMFGGS